MFYILTYLVAGFLFSIIWAMYHFANFLKFQTYLAMLVVTFISPPIMIWAGLTTLWEKVINIDEIRL